MNRYILLTSAHRNREEDPNPFQFTASYNSLPTTKRTAPDWVSQNAPVLNFDLRDYFVDTTVSVAPYQWYQTGLIIGPATASDRYTFQVTIDARGNVGAPDPVSGQYTGLTFEYDNGTTVYSETITNFEAIGNSTFEITLARPIDVVIVAPDENFRILTPFLNLNETYVPSPLSPILVENAYTTFILTEFVQEIASAITAFDADTQVLTATTSFSFATTTPQQFTVSPQVLGPLYTLQTVNVGARTVTVNIADNPSLPNPDFQYQHAYQFSNGYSAQIISSTTLAGVLTLTFETNTDMTQFIATQLISILLFSYDNNSPFDYQGSMRDTQWQDWSQVRIYDLSLLSLQIPNRLLVGSPGGLPVSYPYLMVFLENLSSEQRAEQIIYTNNPNLNKANFVCPVMDISTPEFAAFTKLDGCGITFPFNIKANDAVRLTVHAPNGKVLESATLDTESPIPPNPMLQVSALFVVTQRPVASPCKY